MKTTIELSDDVFRQAKALAAREGTTLRQVFERSLRSELKVAASKAKAPRFSLRDASFGRGGTTPEFHQRGGWANLRDLANER